MRAWPRRAGGHEAWGGSTYGELPSAVEALNLVYSAPDAIEQVVEPFFAYHLLGGVKDEPGVGRDIVVDLHGGK
ncbi:hypothetical protein TRAPUB_2542 [Trametes pubescens]|uniref:Uncharacterized protein n=1 Tax=Trametes pubescens TaxID=154538 RepID=A0A1M2VG88_TRAPU|nr:hypothetical protein TRAPUB_2542 [Trametes pubescens]